MSVSSGSGANECYFHLQDPLGLEYRGSQNQMKSGKSCQDWRAQSPNTIPDYTDMYVSAMSKYENFHGA